MVQGCLAGLPAALVTGCPSLKPSRSRARAGCSAAHHRFFHLGYPATARARWARWPSVTMRLAPGHDGADLRRHAPGPIGDQPPAQRDQFRLVVLRVIRHAPQHRHPMRGRDVPLGTLIWLRTRMWLDSRSMAASSGETKAAAHPLSPPHPVSGPAPLMRNGNHFSLIPTHPVNQRKRKPAQQAAARSAQIWRPCIGRMSN